MVTFHSAIISEIDSSKLASHATESSAHLSMYHYSRTVLEPTRKVLDSSSPLLLFPRGDLFSGSVDGILLSFAPVGAITVKCASEATVGSAG